MNALKSLSIVVLLCSTISHSHGNTIITNPGPGPANAFSGGNNTFGYDFTVGSNSLLVTALGLWDANQDGFTNSHSVGLWDNSGNLLGSVLLSAGTGNSLSGDFRYATLLTPVTLLAGTTYVLGASFIFHDADGMVTNSATFDPAVTSGKARQGIGSGFAFPADNGQLTQGSFYIGPNAQFTLLNANAVPETGPGAFILLLAFASLIYAHRRFSEFEGG